MIILWRPSVLAIQHYYFCDLVVRVIVFQSLYSQLKDLIVMEKILLIKGKLSDKDSEAKFIADEIKELGQQTLSPLPQSVTIKIPEAATDELFGQLKELFESAPGDLNVNLMIKEQKVKTPFRIDLNEDLKSKIKQLLGT